MFIDKMIEEEGRKGFTVLKLIIKKLQTHLQLSHCRRAEPSGLKFDGGLKANVLLPEDVKGGHFAVFAVNTEKPQRFVVELRFLTNPAFLRLLKQAEEEYGFRQKGVLAVPCQPEELQKILQQKVGRNADAGDCNTNSHQKENPEVRKMLNFSRLASLKLSASTRSINIQTIL